MIKKTLSILVIVSLLGFSTAYAYDGEDDGHDQSVNVAVIAALTFTTIVLLAAALDSHDRYGDHRGHGRYGRPDRRGEYEQGGPGRYDGQYPYPPQPPRLRFHDR